jgi:predicted  nucleic acid-binding Zn-ribbon protein
VSRWDVLLVVQEHDTTVDQIAHRRRTLPARGQLEEAMAKLTAVEARAVEVEAGRAELARGQQRLEDEISLLRDKVKQHDTQLYSGTIANPRDLQALQDEIAALRRRIVQLEDQELEVMEQIEPLEAELARLGQEREDVDGEAGRLRAAIAEQEVELDAELAGVRAERDAAAAQVEPALLEEYEDLRPRLGGIAIARLVGGSCGGCHLALSAMEVDRIRHLAPEEPARCEECGRLLAR